MKVITILLLTGLIGVALAGCAAPQQGTPNGFTAEPIGTISISPDWGVSPGKFEVGQWDGEVHTFYFELYNTGEDACFQINGDEHSSTCVPRGGYETVKWFASEDTQFTVKRIGQGSIQHEVLCKIEAK